MKELKLLCTIQIRLELLLEDAYRYYTKGIFTKRSTKTYEDGLMTALEVIEDYKKPYIK